MSSASFMEKLLDGIDVEWKALGEIAQILNGYAFESSKYSTNGIRVIRISDVQKGKMSDKDLKFYPSETSEEIKRYLLQENDLVMSLTGNVGRVAMLSKADIPAALNQRVACIRVHEEKTFTRYLFHFFDQFSFENEAMSNATGGGQKNMSTKWLSAYKIPIPCSENPKKSLEIQAEIVRILDTFTELTAELTAELSMRKKQYNYYRDKLLSFNEGEVEWKALGDVVDTIKTGKLNANAMSEDGEYPFFTCDANPFKIDSYAFDTEAIIVSGNGSQVGHINYYKGKFNAYQRTYILADCSDEITMGFLLTYLKAYLRPYIFQHSKKGSVPYITMPMLQNFKIPILSIKKQTEITYVLDKFDTLTHSISEGLPREIELRQQQYEYYRDFLLSFPKPDEEAA